MNATAKQIDFILSLAGVSYLSQLNKVLPDDLLLTQRDKNGQLSKSKASRIIDWFKNN